MAVDKWGAGIIHWQLGEFFGTWTWEEPWSWGSMGQFWPPNRAKPSPWLRVKKHGQAWPSHWRYRPFGWGMKPPPSHGGRKSVNWISCCFFAKAARSHIYCVCSDRKMLDIMYLPDILMKLISYWSLVLRQESATSRSLGTSAAFAPALLRGPKQIRRSWLLKVKTGRLMCLQNLSFGLTGAGGARWHQEPSGLEESVSVLGSESLFLEQLAIVWSQASSSEVASRQKSERPSCCQQLSKSLQRIWATWNKKVNWSNKNTLFGFFDKEFENFGKQQMWSFEANLQGAWARPLIFPCSAYGYALRMKLMRKEGSHALTRHSWTPWAFDWNRILPALNVGVNLWSHFSEESCWSWMLKSAWVPQLLHDLPLTLELSKSVNTWICLVCLEPIQSATRATVISNFKRINRINA